MAAEYPLLDEPRSALPDGRQLRWCCHPARGLALSASALVRLLLQSGSFAFSDIGRHQRGPVFDPVVRFMNEFREESGSPAERIFMSCGMYESLIYENRSLVPLLQAQGRGSALRGSARRAQLGKLARPASQRTVLAVSRARWMVYE